jgi:hypothetical protein
LGGAAVAPAAAEPWSKLLSQHPLASFALLIGCFALLCAACTNNASIYDFDGDGAVDAVDCGPQDPAIYPGATENCADEIDNDCDSWIDCADNDCQSEPACAGDDDDTSSGDDDTGDDDTAPGDDDAGDDDSSPGDDDTSPGDDDTYSGDDDTSGDDDSSSGDDDSSPGDDDTYSGDDDTSGDDDSSSGDDDSSPGDDDTYSGDDDTSGESDPCCAYHYPANPVACDSMTVQVVCSPPTGPGSTCCTNPVWTTACALSFCEAGGCPDFAGACP